MSETTYYQKNGEVILSDCNCTRARNHLVHTWLSVC